MYRPLLYASPSDLTFQPFSPWVQRQLDSPLLTFDAPDAFNKDTDPRKVSLGVGAYRGDNGKPVVLDSVRKAEKLVLDKLLNHEYAGIAGEPYCPRKQNLRSWTLITLLFHTAGVCLREWPLRLGVGAVRVQ